MSLIGLGLETRLFGMVSGVVSFTQEARFLDLLLVNLRDMTTLAMAL